MTSSSSVGSTRINLQFGLDRDINGAARDVEAAINAARADLPTSLRTNPTYHKVNPADSPIMILTLTSDTLRRGQLYDAASTVLAQKLSQVDGIGEVIVGGSSLPAVRVDLIPQALNNYGIGLEDVRAALGAANAHSPKGGIDVADRRYQIYANDQANDAEAYRPLIVAYRNGAPVHLSDVGEVSDAVEDIRNAGLADGKPAVLLVLFRQPNANVIGIVDRVMALMPQLRASISPAIDLGVALDRSRTIRSSLRDVEWTLMIASVLVILVVFAFLRNGRVTLIPTVAVPVSLIGTFAIMYLLGYSLDNISLMALTVATGFVVDDAIVVLENISRHIEAGMSRVDAAIRGAQEVGFTVVSMSISLIAVFIPILLMGGIVGRLFREFAVTISVAILISLALSLSTTPMMCAVLLRRDRGQHGWLYLTSERFYEAMRNGYRRTLAFALRNRRLVMLILLATIGLNFYLYDIIPKGFFPQQDTGRLMGSIQADQSISFQLMQQKLTQFVSIIKNDPAVDTVVGFTGGGSGGASGRSTNSGNVYISLRPLSERKLSADQVIDRLRPQLAVVPGATLFLQAAQDIRVGGRQGNAEYQYTLQGATFAELNEWGPKITTALQGEPQLADVNSDQQNKGLESNLVIDRDTAARLGLTVSQIDNTLYDAFGQRQVSTIFVARNEYHVIMEVAPKYWQNPQTLNDVYVSTSGGAVGGSQATNAVAGTAIAQGQSVAVNTIASDAARNLATNSIGTIGHATASTGSAVSTSRETIIPLSAVSHFGPGAIPLAVNHQGLFVANTISFNLAPGVSLGTAVDLIEATMTRLGVPATIHGTFQGTAKAFQDSLANQPFLILAALVTIYIVLGILYESYFHPLTILSTLPSAGVGALLALMAFGMEFSIMSLIGVILLIGIVKKNAIMMIDFALDAQRTRGLSALRMDRDIAAQLLDESQAPQTLSVRFGAIGSVHQLGYGYDRETDIDFTVSNSYLFGDVWDVVAAPLGCHHDAGVENQSHAGGFQGSRLRMISSTSVAKSESRTGDSPLSSSCFLAKWMHSEMLRRSGTGRWITATGSLPPSLSMTISAPARTRARTEAKSLAASSSEMWIIHR